MRKIEGEVSLVRVMPRSLGSIAVILDQDESLYFQISLHANCSRITADGNEIPASEATLRTLLSWMFSDARPVNVTLYDDEESYVRVRQAEFVKVG